MHVTGRECMRMRDSLIMINTAVHVVPLTNQRSRLRPRLGVLLLTLPPCRQVPAFEWFRDSAWAWRKQLGGHIIEFTQEAGEVVYVPDNWAHAVINLEPSIGVSKQMGTFQFPEGVPDSVNALLQRV